MDAQTEKPLPPEPTLILRGRDEGAADAIIGYARHAEDLGASADHVAFLRQKAQEFRDYPVSVVPGREKAGSVPGSSIPNPEIAAEAPAAAAAAPASGKA